MTMYDRAVIFVMMTDIAGWEIPEIVAYTILYIAVSLIWNEGFGEKK